jgi:hypothetical protein
MSLSGPTSADSAFYSRVPSYLCGMPKELALVDVELRSTIGVKSRKRLNYKVEYRSLEMSKGRFLKPVRSQSLSRQVYETLKEAIFNGRFQPDEALRELHLAKMFEVSQATIREALVQLEQTGLVVRHHNRKTTVAWL